MIDALIVGCLMGIVVAVIGFALGCLAAFVVGRITRAQTKTEASE